jgi:hypothetical protein
MSVKNYLPYEHYTLITKLSPDVARKRLAENIEPPKIAITQIFKSTYTKPYKGHFSNNSFEMSRVITGRNSFLPIIRGWVSPQMTGAQIFITMRPVIAVIIFMFFWLGVVGLVCLGGIIIFIAHFKQILHNGFSPAAVIPYGMFAFGYLLCTLSFKYESKKSKAFLANLLEGEEKEK